MKKQAAAVADVQPPGPNERTGVYQIACKDPDGCGVELNFQGVKAA